MPHPSRPLVLNPAVRVLWRPDSTVQLELGERAVIVSGPSAGIVTRLGRRPQPPARRSRSTAATLQALTDAGFLWPAPAGAPDDTDGAGATDGDVDERLVAPRPRLAGELAGLQARAGQGAAELLSARRAATVAVQGNGRAGPHLAALLAAAGVGHVVYSAAGAARLTAAVPGGLLPADEGRPLARAATDAIGRAAPDARTEPLGPDSPPDLVVIAADEPLDPDRSAALHRQGAPHLLVALGADSAAVGPLVLPGFTSCLRCADLHRLDRDPDWNALAVQLAVPRRPAGGTSAALATVATGTAALQALAFLDGESPATLEGTLEIRLPDWRLRRRSRPRHPDCDCASDGVAATKSL